MLAKAGLAPFHIRDELNRDRAWATRGARNRSGVSGAIWTADCAAQFAAKQYKRPEPPVRTSASWLQPADWCEKFQDFAQFSGSGPVRSWWPTMAEPSPLLVQAPQVVSV